MTTKANHTFSADFEQVYAKVTDPEFLRAKYLGIGGRNVSFSESAQDGDVFRLVSSREVPSNPPAFARKFLADWNKMDETMEWKRNADGSARGTYTGKVKGVPGVLEGTFDLRPDGSGCVEDIAMTAHIRVPLVGKKIAAIVEGETADSLVDEYEFLCGELGES